MDTSTSGNDIIPYLVALEVLGPDSMTQTENLPVWVRCFIEFRNLAGEDVIDIPVSIDLVANEKWHFSSKCLHVDRFDEELVKNAIQQTLQTKRATTAEEVFQHLDELGYSEV